MLKKKSIEPCPNAATCKNDSCAKRMAFEILKGPEALVGVGFRCWMSGYQTSDINCWETGWNHFAKSLGVGSAKRAITELATWVRAVNQSAARDIAVYPNGSAGFCADECMAISMIAAAQHSVCPAMRACAYALIGSNLVDNVVESAENFAHVLGDVGVQLAPGSIAYATPVLQQASDAHLVN